MTTAINNNRTELWKQDVIDSVDFYNNWFLNFAPDAYRSARNEAIDKVDSVLIQTKNFTNISKSILKKNPEILAVLRMATAPPIARERLIGFSWRFQKSCGKNGNRGNPSKDAFTSVGC